ncbi:hypothetical protein [Archaeoglobus sp.]
MFGYGKASLFGDLEKAREAVNSIKPSELQKWMQRLPKAVVEKEAADVIVLVFVVERLKEV